ncbi:MAG: hypothetical protein AAB405_02060 [Patescibacteria group bacterium]
METTNKININHKIFRAYDIRGKYPAEINEEIVCVIISLFISKFKIKNEKLKIAVAHDTRLSSPTLYHAIIEQLTISNQQLAIIKIGLSTTPMFYFLANYFNADLGIMITASHNPKEYNGLKIVGKNAMPISGEEVSKLVN